MTNWRLGWNCGPFRWMFGNITQKVSEEEKSHQDCPVAVVVGFMWLMLLLVGCLVDGYYIIVCQLWWDDDEDAAAQHHQTQIAGEWKGVFLLACNASLFAKEVRKSCQESCSSHLPAVLMIFIANYMDCYGHLQHKRIESGWKVSGTQQMFAIVSISFSSFR